MVESAQLKKLLDYRPESIKQKVGSDSRICLLNSRHIFETLYDDPIIIIAANTRIKYVIPGIMHAAQELDAIIAFELAKTECNQDIGYTGFNPETFVETILSYAEQIKFHTPFFIHGDHMTVKTPEEDDIAYTEKTIEAGIKAGYTSFAIDASFNELDNNIMITKRLAKLIMEHQLGLEVEVGEIKTASTGEEGSITTVEEATTYIRELVDSGIKPNLLAINNGSKHGNYKPGEEVSINLERTGEIFTALKKYKVAIAQHGITGTPLGMVGKFADFGIRKGNVGTQWQNICHKYFPEKLMNEIKHWTEDMKKPIKHSSKEFKEKIDMLDKDVQRNIENHSFNTASEYIRAFRSDGSASKFAKKFLEKKES